MMINLGKDLIIYLYKILASDGKEGLKDCVNFSLTCKTMNKYFPSKINLNKNVLGNEIDPIWKLLLNNEFGDVLKSDFELLNNNLHSNSDKAKSLKLADIITWKECYFTFKAYYSTFYKEDLFENRKPGTYSPKNFCNYESFLYRRPDKSMMLPLDSFKKPLDSYCRWKLKYKIRPRRGDTFVNLKKCGYRNDGISFWNGTRTIKMSYDSDDYGQTPREFSYPEFPFEYFYNGHNTVQNIKITKEMKIEQLEWPQFLIDDMRCEVLFAKNTRTVRLGDIYSFELNDLDCGLHTLYFICHESELSGGINHE